jgi:hypothetical protein
MLLPPNLTTSIALAEATRQIAFHVSSAARLANRLSETLLNLDDESLAEWLNTNGPAAQSLFAAHGTFGDMLNTAAETIDGVLGGSGIISPIPRVDTRPFPEKLAGRGRGIVVSKGVVSVGPAPTPPEDPNDD